MGIGPKRIIAFLGWPFEKSLAWKFGWFSLLVEDPTKDARIDEDFTPIIEQDGYEQNVLYLSGGERTSVALAYRLALNMLVRRVSASMKSGLLILDEPTDGFSKEQLFKNT